MTLNPVGSMQFADFDELDQLAIKLVSHQHLKAAAYIIGILQTDLAKHDHLPITKAWAIPGQAAPEGWNIYKGVLNRYAEHMAEAKGSKTARWNGWDHRA